MLFRENYNPMRTRTYIYILYPLLLAVWGMMLAGCHYRQEATEEEEGENQELPGGIDSVAFRQTHHYWTGYNLVATDSITLQASQDSVRAAQMAFISDNKIYRNDPLVVAAVVIVPADTIDTVWVKVARDQLTQGWVRESELLDKAVPDDPISKFIHRFSRGRSFYVVCCFGIAVAFLLLQLFRHKHLRMVHFRDISSFYPTLLCITVSGAAALYGSIQRFVPETWEEFYFHPTLNPLHPDLPLILALFIASVWTMIIVGVAVVEELRRQPDLGDGLAYLASLGGVCMLLYLVFTQTVPLYFGYPLLLAYWAWAVMRYVRHRPSHFLCGNCNNPIPTGTDICPKCGMRNSL